MSSSRTAIKVVHLPVYTDNAYQPLLMKGLAERGLEVVDGGGGGNFLRTALFKWKADLYHFHWLHPYLLRRTRVGSLFRATRFLLEVLLLRLSGARVLWTIHNLSNHDRRFVTTERLYSRAFARLAGGFIVHSWHAKKLFRTVFAIPERKPIAVIPQGSYVEHYPNRKSRSQSRAELSLSDDEFVFLFLGRIERYKGVIELVHAFKRLEERAALLIAGRVSDSKLHDELAATIGDADNVRFEPSFVDDDDLQTYFNAADVFVLPARKMLNSSSISLAASFGLPVILPAECGTGEAAREAEALCYDPTDADGLLRAMTLAIDRRGDLSAIGGRSIIRARERSWGTVALETEVLYRSILDESTATPKREEPQPDEQS